MRNSTIRNSSLLVSLPLLLLLGSSACSDNPCASRHCEVKTSVATLIDFALEEEEGVSLGFDLDDRVSEDRDSKTCGHSDLKHPDGASGIDNNAAVLFEAISSLTEASLEGLIRGSINEGRLLMVFQLHGVDSIENDDCVDVEIFQATGTPFVGTDEYILPGQTFDIDHEQPRTSLKCAKIKDGILTAGPFEGHLFVSILGVHVNFNLANTKIAATLDENGIPSVTMGAGIETDEMHSVVDQSNDGTVSELAHFLIDTLADMGNDGQKCNQVSSTVLIETTNAYIF